MAKFFRFPWAISGDKTAIPEVAQVDDSQSYEEGFPFPYQRDPLTDPLFKFIPRDQFNQLMYDITDALRQYQAHGYPDFITTADNGGTPFSYGISDYVRYDDGSGFAIYESIAALNTSLPTDDTKWRKIVPQQAVPVGTLWPADRVSLPSGGWIWADGKTIGNAASGATNRANADTQSLFLQIWADFPNSVRPIQDSTGAASTRGVSAAADYAANKRLPVADTRGRTLVGKDDMGGTAANRITSAGSGISGDTLGASGGQQNVSLTSDQGPAHTHDLGSITTDSAGNHSHTNTYGPVPPGSGGTTTQAANGGNVDGAAPTKSTSTNGAHTHTLTGNTSSAGNGEAHQNVQPTYVCQFILKL